MNLIGQIVLIYVSYLLVIASHEGGHALAIRYAGYPWESCQIGPVFLQPGKRPRWSGTLFGGGIEYIPRRWRGALHKEVLILMGGILVNLLVGVVTSVLYSLLPRSQQAQEWYLPFVSILSLAMVVGSFLPISQRYAALDSDGLLLLKLLLFRKR